MGKFKSILKRLRSYKDSSPLYEIDCADIENTKQLLDTVMKERVVRVKNDSGGFIGICGDCVDDAIEELVKIKANL